MKKHTYYQLHFTLISPMNISSGENINTDADVLKDRAGNPYIPGSTLTGVLRSVISDKKAAESLFGSEEIRDDSFVESTVLVYDAKLKEGLKARWEQRDHVRLDQYKVPKDGFKFDEECIEPGAKFIGYLEMPGKASEEKIQLLESALGKLAAQKCGFGRKITRGFGRANLTVFKKDFDLDQEEELKAWLDFSPFGKDAFDGAKALDLETAETEDLRIRLNLQLLGGISVRVYLTDPNNGKEKNVADYTTLKSNGLPVIPGSSWAGAFRHRYHELAKITEQPDTEKELFGTAEESTGRRSCISFSETALSDSHRKIMTRNAIDRASGKTKDSALYTEETYYGGTGDLDILIRRNVSPEALQLFGACLCDYVHGYIAVGGLSSVGRGTLRTNTLEISGDAFDLKQEGWENRLIAKLKEAVVK